MDFGVLVLCASVVLVCLGLFTRWQVNRHYDGSISKALAGTVWWEGAAFFLGWCVGTAVAFPFTVFRHLKTHEKYDALEGERKQLYDRLFNGLMVEEAPHPLKPTYIVSSQMLCDHEFIYGRRHREATEARTLPSYLSDPKGVIDEAVGVISQGWGVLDRALGTKKPPYPAEQGMFETGIHNIISPDDAHEFAHVFERKDKLFWDFFSLYCQNSYKANTAAENKVCRFGDKDYYNRLFANTPFHSLFQSNVPITIPDKVRFEGTFIVSPQGGGKTTLLSHLLNYDLMKVRRGNASIIVMDSSEQLTKALRKLAIFAKGGILEDKLVVIDPAEDLALNPLDLRTTPTQAVSLLRYFFSALLPLELTGKQSVLFSRVMLAMQAIPKANFQTFRDFLVDWKGFATELRKLPAEDQDFFFEGEYDDKKQWGDTRRELSYRIDGLMLEIPALRGMFRATETLFRLGDAMNEGKVIIINNSEDRLGSGMIFFTRFFLSLVKLEAMRRTGMRDEDKLPCFVYLDEAARVIAEDETINDIITQCRKHKIGLVLACQKLSDITNRKVEAALKDCAVLFANPQAEAPALASLFMTSADTLRRVKAKKEFAFIMRDMTRPLIVDVPDKHVSTWEKMTPEQYKVMMGGMRQYHYDPDKLPPRTKPSQSPTGDKATGKDW